LCPRGYGRVDIYLYVCAACDGSQLGIAFDGEVVGRARACLQEASERVFAMAFSTHHRTVVVHAAYRDLFHVSSNIRLCFDMLTAALALADRIKVACPAEHPYVPALY
jgi:hypothetical protein